MVKEVNKLLDLFIKNNYISEYDRTYFENYIFCKMKLRKNTKERALSNNVATLFNSLGEYVQKNIGIEKNYFINDISGILTPRPSVIQKKFEEIEKKDHRKAFDYLFNLSNETYYIKYDRLKKNKEWVVNTDYGKIIITINLAKPEKTPSEIKAAKSNLIVKFPKCNLCRENVGFVGSSNHPPKQNLRVIIKTFEKQKFFFHYSPYGYYKEHLIVNKWEHTPIKIDIKTFKYLLAFVKKYPFYSIGSNSDISIVGGSILSHYHFQGGGGIFPIFDSKVIKSILKDDIKYEILKWPIATIRLSGKNINKIISKASLVTKAWYKYENKDIGIINNDSIGERHNAITPFVRYHNKEYQVYLLLRNNITTKSHPDGYFHLHDDVWNIKRENIGIIEGLGKAILPGRLSIEFDELSIFMYENLDVLPEHLSHHQKWIENIRPKKPLTLKECKKLINEEAGKLFVKGLSDCNVFKEDKDEFFKFFKMLVEKNHDKS